jgi:hypothetical protein
MSRGAKILANRIVRGALLRICPSCILAFLVFAAVIFFAGGPGKSRRVGTERSGGSGGHSIVKPDARIRAMDFYRDMPMSFEVNDGQEVPGVKFISRGHDYGVFLTEEAAIFALKKDAKAATSSFTMKFRGANNVSHISGLEKLSRTTNYFVGRDPSKWRTSVANYARVEYPAIYPGIDLVYYGKDHELEYDLIVQPTARPSDIRIDFSGIGCTPKIHLDSHGDLTVRTMDGEVRMHRPLVYQRGRNDEEVRIQAHYVITKGPVRSIKKNQEVALRVGNYDQSEPLIIDPVMTFSTFLGGSSFDTAKAVAVDSTGNVYVVGGTFSTDFPTVNPIQPNLHGSNGDAFVTKINAAGTAILYSTYLGGSFTQQANGVAVDSAGNAYLVGQTASNDFPVTQGAFDTSCSSCGTNSGVAFVSKLDSTGSQLVYSTYLGGTGGDATGDRGDAIAVDAAGLAYVTGGSFSPDYPTTPGAFQRARIGDMEQVFVTVLNTGGSALNYSTYVGGGEGFGIAVSASGNAYVAGATDTATFPTTAGALQTTFGGPGGSANDAFITQLNSSGSALVYSTFLGGTSEDYAGGVAIDEAGNAYVTGQTYSTNFPVKNAFQQTLKGQANAFVAKLNTAGSALVYSTYLGGSNDDDGDAIAVDSGGDAYVTGFTESTDFPLVGALQGTYGGSMDAFLTVVGSNGIPSFSTFLGGQLTDEGNGIAVDSSGNVYLTGLTQSIDFPVLNALQPSLAISSNHACNPSPCPDAFLTKFSASTPTPPTDFALELSPATASIAAGQPETFTVTLTSIGGFNQIVSLGCSVQPSGPTCSIPPSLTSTGLSSPIATVSVRTIAATPSSSLNTERDNWTNLKTGLHCALLLGLYGVLLFVFLKRTRVHVQLPASWIGLSAILFLVVLLQACGGGGSGTGGGGGGGGTKPGTYTITVTGTSASLSHSEAFTLTVD